MVRHRLSHKFLTVPSLAHGLFPAGTQGSSWLASYRGRPVPHSAELLLPFFRAFFLEALLLAEALGHEHAEGPKRRIVEGVVDVHSFSPPYEKPFIGHRA
jgi:hypothetical protein